MENPHSRGTLMMDEQVSRLGRLWVRPGPEREASSQWPDLWVKFSPFSGPRTHASTAAAQDIMPSDSNGHTGVSLVLGCSHSVSPAGSLGAARREVTARGTRPPKTEHAQSAGPRSWPALETGV